MSLSCARALALWLVVAPAIARGDDAPNKLADLSLEQLGTVEVTTVSRKPEKQFDAPAAVFVITGEDIRRAGVTSVPEALRLAPGVEVARVDGDKWAIGARGFGSTLSRALLVLIDGRTVYTPLYAGVYWDMQDVFLEDIDRIEVILGPGGTLWGANAVNGVINIITKSAKETHGILATGGGGNYEQGFFGLRGGGQIGEKFHYRLFAKFFNRSAEYHPNGNNYDSWRNGLAGLRVDWDARPGDTVTLIGNFSLGQSGQSNSYATFNPPATVTVTGKANLLGGNLLGRWQHVINENSDARLQIYYDRTDRHDVAYSEDRDTFDIDLQHHMKKLPLRQELIWGLGYRVSSGEFLSVETFAITPPRRTDQLFSGFLQDEIAIVKNLVRLTLGAKVEHNDYTGFEIQPNARLLVTPVKWQTIWASVSRAVRTPSRIETDLQVSGLISPGAMGMPATFARIVGNSAFHSEQVIAFEAGYRIQPVKPFLFSIAAFYNHYIDLLSVEPGMPFEEGTPVRVIVPYLFGNGFDANTYGFEAKADLSILKRLEAHAFYSFLQIDLQRHPDSMDTTSQTSTEGSSPQHMATIWLSVNLPFHIELDPIFRYVSALPAQHVPDYANLDARIGWRPLDWLELSVVGQNLLAAHHLEFAGGMTQTEVIRSVYGKATWRW